LTSYDQTFGSAFRTAAPAEAGVHAGRVRRFLAELHRRALPLHSLLLYRSGRVVAEHYWWPYRADRPHMMHSATKSFTGTAVGFALAEGRLRLADPVVSFFPDQVPASASVPGSEPLRAMTVGDLLTMRTGHRVGLSGKTWRLIDTSWVAEFLAAEVPDPPGRRFTYSSATSHVLSAIVARATGETVADYLRPRLFEPLGFAAHTWDSDPEGYSSGGNGLSLRSVDFLKWGVLHLRDGWWEGRRVLPEGWVARATTAWVTGASSGSWDGARFIPVEPGLAGVDRGYGYQVWLGPGDSYYASGMFGQDCVVLPSQDAAIALTAAIPGGRHQELSELVYELLVPAFDGPGSAADDRRLAEELSTLAEPPVPAPPVVPALDVAGRDYHCDPNEDGVTGLRFDLAGAELAVTLTDSRGTHRVPCGLAGWTESESTVTSWRLHHSYQPPRQRVLCGARWSTPRTLTLDWYFVESPFHDTVTVEFLPGDRLRWSRSVNVNSGTTTRPPITATATPEPTPEPPA
jgi:CubicO group peptidase (beta-lactamase class C family)